MRPEDEPQGIPVPFGGMLPPTPKINAEPKMMGQVSRDPRGWKTTLPNVPLGGQSAQPQTSPQQPPQQPLPSSLDEFVPQTLPTPNLLPKYHGFTETELSLWEPLWMISRGYTLPDDEFSRQMALMGYREQFKKEADLIAFDAYRKNLELRAQHDQRIRQLFAPIAQDFNTVFSSEAIQQALREVINAYKATNPKISWNKLSADAKRREILKFMQQGKLPTVKRFAEQWGRLKSNFQAYKTLLQPADQMVVAELDGILGGSFDDFIMKYLTLNDPEEEEMQRQLQALRQQHQLYRQLMQEFPDLYQRPQIGAPADIGTTGATVGGNFRFGGFSGGGYAGGGSVGGGNIEASSPSINVEWGKFFDNYFKGIKTDFANRKQLPVPSASIVGRHLDVLFNVPGGNINDVATVLSNYLRIQPGKIALALGQNAKTVGDLAQRVAELGKSVSKKPNDQNLINQFIIASSIYFFTLSLLEAENEKPGTAALILQDKSQVSRMFNSIGGVVQNMLSEHYLKQTTRTPGSIQKQISHQLGFGGRDIATESRRQAETGQTGDRRDAAIQNAVRRALDEIRQISVQPRTVGYIGNIPLQNFDNLQIVFNEQAKLNEFITNSQTRFKNSDVVYHINLRTFNSAQEAFNYLKSLPNDIRLIQGIEHQLLDAVPKAIYSQTNQGYEVRFAILKEKTPNNKEVYKVIVYLVHKQPQQQRGQQNRRGR